MTGRRDVWWAAWLVAVAAGAAGLVVRLVNVTDPYNRDESSTMVRFVGRAPAGLWQHYDENNHLLASVLAALVQSTGLTGPAWVRQVAIVPAVLAVCAVAFWCSRRFGWPGGVAAGVLVAATPVVMVQADRVRGYGLALLGAAVVTLALRELWRDAPSREPPAGDRRRWWLVAGGLTVASASWLLAVLPLLAGVIATALRRRSLPARGPLVAAGLLVVLWWSPVAPGLFEVVRSRGRPTPEPATTAAEFTLTGRAPPGEDGAVRLHDWPSAAVTLGAVLGVLVLGALAAGWWARRAGRAPAAAGDWPTVPGTLVLGTAMGLPLLGFLAAAGLFHLRFLEVLVPAGAVAVAGLVPDRWWAGLGLSVAAVPAMVLGTWHVADRPPPAYRDVVRTTLAGGAEDLYVITPQWMPGFQTAAASVTGAPRLHVVVDARARAVRQVLPRDAARMRVTPERLLASWCEPARDRPVAVAARTSPAGARSLRAQLDRACATAPSTSSHRVQQWVVVVSPGAGGPGSAGAGTSRHAGNQ